MAEYVCEVVTEHELCGDVHHYVRKERVVRCPDCAYVVEHRSKSIIRDVETVPAVRQHGRQALRYQRAGAESRSNRLQGLRLAT